MQRFFRVLGLSVLVLNTSSLGAQSPDTASAVLRPGDTVKISVWRKPELSGEFSIAADGSVADPFYSEVKVAGVPLATATERVREYVARIESSPRVFLDPLFRVSVGGEVRTPNLYSLSRETTVAQAIALAGGPTTEGRLDRVVLIRNGSAESVDLTDPNGQWGGAPIRSGDQILIGRRTNFFRDVLAPSSSVIAAVGVVVNILLNR